MSSWPGRPRAPQLTSPPEISLTGLDVPAAVAASLAEELTLLSGAGRLVLEGAAVAGDPFEPELAAAAAATSEAAGMDAVDELLGLDLIRCTDVPRRFRFRHPLVRRAVYEAAAGGWRLGAHERCAEALAARGASAAARAHHVERSARQGDLAAVAVLRQAGEATARLAPESAARWFGGALRLLPQTAPAEDRVELLLARSRALAAAGRFSDSHEAALEAVALVPGQPSALNTTVATACASVERFLGRYEHAHARLVRALRLLPAPASVERAELLIELTLNEFYRSRYEAMRDWAAPAVSAANEVGDAALMAAAGVMPAFAAARVLDWLRSAHARTTFTTSVCTGSLVLGAAGLLDGLTATTHWAVYSELAASGAAPTAERVVEHLDRRIITAAGVSAGIDMALRLTELLADQTAAQAAQLMIEYDPQPPFDCGARPKAGDEVMARVREYDALRQ